MTDKPKVKAINKDEKLKRIEKETNFSEQRTHFLKKVERVVEQIESRKKKK